MNVAYFALAATFAALAAALFARGKKEPPAKARTSRIAGALLMATAVAFIAAGILGMRSAS